MTIETQPLTPDRWSDFETLMGPRGGAAGCWCTVWRHGSAAAYRAGKGAANRRLMRTRVRDGDRPPGLLAYRDGTPVGWVSVAPRAEFSRLAGARIAGPVDDLPVWSVTCFFIKRGQRGQGVASALLRAACAFAAGQGAAMIEGYPVDPRGERCSQAAAWTGVVRLFEQAGFTECARPSDKRRLMRRRLVAGAPDRGGS